MTGRNFWELLRARWAAGKFVCVGLDSDFKKIPEAAHRPGNECTVDVANTMVAFNRAIVEATGDTVCAFKPNAAFYEAHGAEGAAALQRTIRDIHAIAPAVPVILDYKRGDIGNTNTGYVEEAFNFFRVDAVTVNPYLGAEALAPFLELADKGFFVLCRTSNKGGGEFQNLPLMLSDETLKEIERRRGREMFPGEFLYLYYYLAYRVATAWNKNNNCGLVVGATCPEELEQVRRIVGDMPILIPGIGAQGGDVEKTVKAGKDSQGQGMIINSSRGIIFASNGPDFAEAARREATKLHDMINQYR